MAGSKTNTFENEALLLIFNNTTVSGIGSDGLRGSTTAGNLYVALYEMVPADASDGTETTYTNYARVAVPRASVTGWTVSGNAVSNAVAVTFPQCGASGATIVGFAICKADVEGVDDAIYWGDLTAPLAVSSGITPEFAIGDIDITED